MISERHTNSTVTHVDVPHEVGGGQGQVDVLRQRELLSDPPGGQDGGGLGVLGEPAPKVTEDFRRFCAECLL